MQYHPSHKWSYNPVRTRNPYKANHLAGVTPNSAEMTHTLPDYVVHPQFRHKNDYKPVNSAYLANRHNTGPKYRPRAVNSKTQSNTSSAKRSNKRFDLKKLKETFQKLLLK